MKKYGYIGLVMFSLGYNAYFYFQNRSDQGKVVRLEGDKREAIFVKAEHKEFVLNEMREFVNGLHLISKGIETQNPELIIEAAANSGTSVNPPKELVASMPKSFLKMGGPVHKLFDEMADSAKLNFKVQTTQRQLTELTNRCVACHSSFRLEPK